MEKCCPVITWQDAWTQVCGAAVCLGDEGGGCEAGRESSSSHCHLDPLPPPWEPEGDTCPPELQQEGPLRDQG